MFLSFKRLKRTWASSLLILTTFFWGATFVLVKDAISHVDVFVFLAQRFTTAFLLLLVVGLVLWRSFSLGDLKRAVILGTMLFGGFALQTWALRYTSASNTAFLTGLNVVLVPLFSSVIFRHHIQNTVKIGVFLSLIGLYLLCVRQSWIFNKGDFLAFLCALFVAIHIIYTGRYSLTSDLYWLSTFQIGVVAMLSVLSALFTGHPVLEFHPEIVKALVICVLFATIFAYLVQTTMQKYISPANTALIFCLEPVFAAICAYVIIGERLGFRGIMGGILMFIGMVFPEIPFKKLRSKKRA